MRTAATPLAEGKTKIIEATDTPGEVLVTFKDDATAFNAAKHTVVAGKGAINAAVTRLLFERLADAGLPVCYRCPGPADNQLVYQALAMIPLEVVVRNQAYGSFVKRYGVSEGLAFDTPVVEFFHKTHDDPLLGEDALLALGILESRGQIERVRSLALQANEVFSAFFAARGIRCADFKIELGWSEDRQLLIGDELSPDNFRLRDAQTGQVLDKDVFRLDLADLKETYQALLARLATNAPEAPATARAYRAEVFVHSRKNIFSPESKAIQDGLHTMGHHNVTRLIAGRRFTFDLVAPSLIEAERQATALTDGLLANPVIEDYTVRVLPAETETDGPSA